jgi:hypothetical protein
MEALKHKVEPVGRFRMRFRNINNRIGWNETNKAVRYDFYGRIKWNVRKNLVAGRNFETFRELHEAVSLMEQDQKFL